MWDAACPGEVFPSPVPNQILAATKAVDAGAGVLHIVKNYTGDVLNFQMAAELAADDGVRVEAVVVNDDVAVENSTWTAGRRGPGATVFVEKIVGAAAERGADLAAAAALAREVNDRSRSFGVALTPCTVPAAGKPGFELGDDEIEIGVGIHGEPGRTRGRLGTAREIAGLALDAIHPDMPLSGDAQLVDDNADHLTHLDAAIGDADHGINLRRGLRAAVTMLDESDPPTPGAVLATVGRALISKTGGASGPLYGTGFRHAAKTLGEDADVSAVQLGAALRAALDGIRQLGAAGEGDKTMVDALAPAVSAYQAVVDTGGSLAEATRAAADAAAAGRQATIGLTARKGRASYLGPRTIGHEDPGAASTALILQAPATATAGPAPESAPA